MTSCGEWLKEILALRTFLISERSLIIWDQTTLLCYPLFHQMVIKVGYEQVQFRSNFTLPKKLMCQLAIDTPFSVKTLISPKFWLGFSVHFKRIIILFCVPSLLRLVWRLAISRPSRRQHFFETKENKSRLSPTSRESSQNFLPAECILGLRLWECRWTVEIFGSMYVLTDCMSLYNTEVRRQNKGQQNSVVR